MNKTVSQFYRESILLQLRKCRDVQVIMFKRMYSPDDLDASIETVVNLLSDEKLDHALNQVEKTIRSNG